MTSDVPVKPEQWRFADKRDYQIALLEYRVDFLTGQLEVYRAAVEAVLNQSGPAR